MAFIQAVDAGSGQSILYNIEQSVGANAVNAPEDVRLVQYLLRAFYGVRAGNLAMDGWGGAATNAWIKAFQEDMNAAGNKVLADGRFDRAFGSTSSVSRTVYGIVLLNLAVARCNPAAFRALPSAVELNPNPRANPYNPAQTSFGRVSVISLRGGVYDITFEDGTSGQYVVPEGHSLHVDNVEIREGHTYVRMPDGTLRDVDSLNPWT